MMMLTVISVKYNRHANSVPIIIGRRWTRLVNGEGMRSICSYTMGSDAGIRDGKYVTLRAV